MAKSLRIVHVTDYSQPKLGYQEVSLARAQIRAGHEAFIVTSDRYRPFPDYERSVRPVLGERVRVPGRGIEEGIPIYRLPVRFEYWYRVWLKGLVSTIDELAPDVVVVHGVLSFNAIRAARMKTATPPRNFRLIIDDHMVPGTQGHSKAGWVHRIFRLTLAPIIQRRADALVAVYSATTDYMTSHYGFPPEALHLIPLGADTNVFFPASAESRSALRSRLGLESHETVFIYAGKLIPEKGAHLLVDAALSLIPRHPTIRIMMVGAGPAEYVARMKALAEAQEVADRVMWIGAVPNSALADLYRSADIGVWPRLSSLTMIEAQACGLPVVVSDFPPAVERVRRGGGLVFRTDDVRDLEAKLEELLLDGERRRRLGREAASIIAATLGYRLLSERMLHLVDL